MVLGRVLALYGQALTHQIGMPVPISPSICGTCLLQAQKKPATLCGFLVETTIFMKSNLSRIRIAACALAGERSPRPGWRDKCLGWDENLGQPYNIGPTNSQGSMLA